MEMIFTDTSHPSTDPFNPYKPSQVNQSNAEEKAEARRLKTLLKSESQAVEGICQELDDPKHSFMSSANMCDFIIPGLTISLTFPRPTPKLGNTSVLCFTPLKTERKSLFLALTKAHPTVWTYLSQKRFESVGKHTTEMFNATISRDYFRILFSTLSDAVWWEKQFLNTLHTHD